MHRTTFLPGLIRRLRPLALAAVLLGGVMPIQAGNGEPAVWEPTTPALDRTERARLEAGLAALAPQRPDLTDMYVLGVAGDAAEDVFRNEVAYLQDLFGQRMGSRGRTLALVNHPERTGTAAIATWKSLGEALDALARTLDPDEDVLFLYMTSHGLEDSSFYLQTAPGQEDVITPEDLAQLLDEAGIGNAVIVVSACYSGGFVPVLASPQRLVITAARHDRPSFGCGNTDSATWFGRAFLVEALNQTADFVAAFEQARSKVARREQEQGELPSEPQLHAGEDILPVLARWRSTLAGTPPLPYPFEHVPPDAAAAPPP